MIYWILAAVLLLYLWYDLAIHGDGTPTEFLGYALVAIVLAACWPVTLGTLIGWHAHRVKAEGTPAALRIVAITLIALVVAITIISLVFGLYLWLISLGILIGWHAHRTYDA